ncbi:nucleotidyltransferase family protein [Williamsia sp. CHRR-6]|uniref:nucleotidyltransferase family protein n=1 Tax=Williamsia sp. CHRR-6 TaxID=2835871 RepID=UPI001BDAA27F|nr:nucleotidyltransferase family protein [Williamsia sp. CHRR-6]MBT0566363.1 nucleotidyltransferase family protein [Williamsia sp. CHRR-6]
MSDEQAQQRFWAAVGTNPQIDAVCARLAELGLPDWYLTGGAVFQTVWNHLDGAPPQAGIADYDVFYFDAADLSYAAEDRVIARVQRACADLPITIEVRNQARVHLWYSEKFGIPAAVLRSTRDGIDHFVSTTCCFGIRRSAHGHDEVYAPHGFDDLFAKIVRPNPVLDTRAVYEAKVARWRQQWPTITALPWDAP